MIENTDKMNCRKTKRDIKPTLVAFYA